MRTHPALPWDRLESAGFFWLAPARAASSAQLRPMRLYRNSQQQQIVKHGFPDHQRTSLTPAIRMDTS